MGRIVTLREGFFADSGQCQCADTFSVQDQHGSQKNPPQRCKNEFTCGPSSAMCRDMHASVQTDSDMVYPA